MANKSSIVSDLHGWRTPSVSGEDSSRVGWTERPGVKRSYFLRFLTLNAVHGRPQQWRRIRTLCARPRVLPSCAHLCEAS